MKKWYKILLWVIGSILGLGLLWYLYLKFFKFNSSKISANILLYANKYGSNSAAVAKMLTDTCNELLALHEPTITAYATANNLAIEDALTTYAFNQLNTAGSFASFPVTTSNAPTAPASN